MYGLDNLGLEWWQGQESHLFYKTFGMTLRLTQPPVYWVSGALPLWLHRHGRVADHIHLLTKLRLGKTTPPLPQYAVMVFTGANWPFNIVRLLIFVDKTF